VQGVEEMVGFTKEEESVNNYADGKENKLA
jgi:hypothetical protein